MMRVNGDRLWNRLMEMGQIGCTPQGGVCREALTDEDKAGRDLFISWCKSVGCKITVDKIGNIFARRKGKDNDLSPVVAHSHLDSEFTGGRFDGAYGVLAGLEVIETLNDYDVITEAPIEVINWSCEESSRFSPGIFGSAIFVGALELEDVLAVQDKSGVTVIKELQRIGYFGKTRVGRRSFKAAFEAHIEQGPILENEGKTIGVVTAIQGVKLYDLIIEGEETHAGPSPMHLRKDPVRGMIRVLKKLYDLAYQNSPWGRLTIGDMDVFPGARNTVPGRLKICVDLRHPEHDFLDAMEKSFRTIAHKECEELNLKCRIEPVSFWPPVKFPSNCVDLVRNAVKLMGYRAMDIVSGSGHDTSFISRIAPSAMIFIPCEKGISHNEKENVEKEDVEAGCNVLLHTMLQSASCNGVQ